MKPLYKETEKHSELINRRAACFNNIALCHLQLDDSRSVIEYTTLVENDFLHVDNDIVIKALIRRGMAHEKLDKLIKAKKDYKKVKMVDPSNLNAS